MKLILVSITPFFDTLIYFFKGDYEGLIKVMEILKIVKEKQATTDTMFEPLSRIIEMLKSYGVIIPEESLVQLTELPEKWANTKR